MIGKNLGKTIKQLLLIFCTLKNKKISFLFQNQEKQVFLLMIPNGKECQAKLEGHKAKSEQ